MLEHASVVLTDEEIAAITKRDRPKVQARILGQLGIPFKIHPVDGTLLVARDAASKVLTGQDAANEVIPTVNVDAIRRRGKHGKAANAGR